MHALVHNAMRSHSMLVTTVCCRLEQLDSDTTEARAASILHGLGFDKAMQAKATREFSGGWRMRISLARALFIAPSFLLLVCVPR